MFCIYPVDETTDFLNKIPEELLTFFGSDFDLIRVYPNDKSHEDAINIIESAPNGSIFIFLGHGNSMTLKGAESGSYCKDVFIDNDKLIIFNNKSLFVLACRSSSLLECGVYISGTNINQSISFPNIISSWEELEHERLVKITLYPNLTKSHIDRFNSIITESTIYCLKGLFENKDFNSIHRRLIHYLNQKMVELVINEPNSANRDLADMIFDLKREIKVVSN